MSYSFCFYDFTNLVEIFAVAVSEESMKFYDRSLSADEGENEIKSLSRGGGGEGGRFGNRHSITKCRGIFANPCVRLIRQCLE